MADPARKLATYDDLVALPETMIGEILDGELVAMPRPVVRHARVTSRLGARLDSSFDPDDGDNGPGGCEPAPGPTRRPQTRNPSTRWRCALAHCGLAKPNPS